MLDIKLEPQKKNKIKGKGKGSYINGLVDETIWEDFVPIVSKSNKVHHVFISSGIEEPVEYNKLVYFLAIVPEDHTVYIHINTPGGIIDSAFMIINAIKSCRATTVARLDGTVASAGTIITLACDKIDVGDYTHFMIHNYSGGTGGKGHEVKAYVDFNNRELNAAFRDIYKGFLTDEEMTEVIEGKDMWLNKGEVLARWESKGE